MKVHSKFLVSMFALVLLGTFAVATTAQAGPALYTGTLHLKGFGNTVTTGTVWPFNGYVALGIPKGHGCNQYYGPTNLICYGLGPKAWYGAPLTAVSAVASIGIAGSNSYPASINIGSELYRKAGDMNSAGSIYTVYPYNAPRPGGSFSYYYPYIYSYTFANLRLEGGVLAQSGGPGNLLLQWYDGTQEVARMSVTEGEHHFGGTMRLLGKYKSIYLFQDPTAGRSYGVAPWLHENVGAAPNTTKDGVPVGFTSDSWLVVNTLTGTHIQHGYAWAVGWTTGSVTIEAIQDGYFSTYQLSLGYDNRTHDGYYGTIQLVSPLMTQWVGPNANYYTAGVGIMHLVFAPEPEEWMMLGAGVSLLGILYRSKRRSA